jgi:hypothetical protein
MLNWLADRLVTKHVVHNWTEIECQVTPPTQLQRLLLANGTFEGQPITAQTQGKGHPTEAPSQR